MVGATLLGVPAHELADRHVLLDAVDSRRAASLVRELAAIEHPAEAPAAIAQAVVRRIDSEWWPDPDVR